MLQSFAHIHPPTSWHNQICHSIWNLAWHKHPRADQMQPSISPRSHGFDLRCSKFQRQFPPSKLQPDLHRLSLSNRARASRDVLFVAPDTMLRIDTMLAIDESSIKATTQRHSNHLSSSKANFTQLLELRHTMLMLLPQNHPLSFHQKTRNSFHLQLMKWWR